MEDYGEGECAGEIVPLVEFLLQASEREVFEAQLFLDAEDLAKSKQLAYRAMLSAAKALVKTEFHDVTDDSDQIVEEFKTRFHETKRFHDRFAGAKFANYLLRAHKVGGNGGRPDQARERVEEAQLFIEAAYACLREDGHDGSACMSGGKRGLCPSRRPRSASSSLSAIPRECISRELIPVFHRWIAEKLIEDELLVDVASYEHVPKGPGIVLICDKAHYYFDVRDGRPGIRYRGRRDADVAGEQGIARAFRSALQAASLLENDPALDGRYRFVTSELEFGIYDRLRAPSDEATFKARSARSREVREGAIRGRRRDAGAGFRPEGALHGIDQDGDLPGRRGSCSGRWRRPAPRSARERGGERRSASSRRRSSGSQPLTVRTPPPLSCMERRHRGPCTTIDG